MKLVNDLRRETGLSQLEFAQKARTSQPTIAAYESGSKSPTLRTLNGMSAAVGMELSTQWVPALTREDKRSLAYHQLIVKKLKVLAVPTLTKARENLARMKKQHPDASLLFDRWAVWLSLPLDDLSVLLLHQGIEHRDMRQVSPFSGILSAAERADAINRLRRNNSR